MITTLQKNNGIRPNGYAVAETQTIPTPGQDITFKTLRKYGSRIEFSHALANAYGYCYFILGMYNMMADNSLRETMLFMKQQKKLKFRVKHLAQQARDDFNRLRILARTAPQIRSHDTFEAATIDFISDLQPYVDSVEMQIRQYLTMHGCKDMELCTKVSLTYLLTGMTERAHAVLIDAIKTKYGIDFLQTFIPYIPQRAMKAWHDLAVLMIGAQAEGIENYTPLENALVILLLHASDIDKLMLKICDAATEYKEDFSDDTLEEVRQGAAHIRRQQAEREKLAVRENAAAKRRLGQQRAKRASSEITDEDLQLLKTKFAKTN